MIVFASLAAASSAACAYPEYAFDDAQDATTLDSVTAETTSDVADAEGARPETTTDAPIDGSTDPLEKCGPFPPDSWWNTPVDTLAADSNSSDFIANSDPTVPLSPLIGPGALGGIPYVLVGASQPKTPILYGATGYPSESDKGPFPIPIDAPSSLPDHVIVSVDTDACMLYELFNGAYDPTSGSFVCDVSVKWPMLASTTRNLGCTSADSSGLPIFPGLVRRDEVERGEIKHAIRFQLRADLMRAGVVSPGSHTPGTLADTVHLPAAARVRLKASFVIDATYSHDAQVILTAMKKYGMFLASGGPSWQFYGDASPRWDTTTLTADFAHVHGSDFEVMPLGTVYDKPFPDCVLPP